MIHKNVYAIYEKLMPFYASQTKEYFPCGLNTIRVRLQDRREFVFSYGKDDSWCFETLDRYIKKMKGAR